MSMKGLKHSEETKEKMRQKAMGRHRTENTRKKLSESMHKQYREGKINGMERTAKAHQTMKNITLDKWKKGTPKTSITSLGYINVYTPIGSILEHCLVWIQKSEWHFIPKGFDVHHINGVKTDNRIENLACLPHGYHRQGHNLCEAMRWT